MIRERTTATADSSLALVAIPSALGYCHLAPSELALFLSTWESLGQGTIERWGLWRMPNEAKGILTPHRTTPNGAYFRLNAGNQGAFIFCHSIRSLQFMV